MFKADDKVICTDDSGCPYNLTKGKVYSVISVYYNSVYIIDDTESKHPYSSSRFSLVEELLDKLYFTNDNRLLRSKEECMDFLNKYGGTLYKKVAEVTLETTTVAKVKEF